MQKTFAFPKQFRWGAATAAYQVEGRIENTDWAQAAREGKVPAAGAACDHYNRYEGDFDIAQSLGHSIHRFSIEWARIEPEEGKFDEKAIAHYRTVIKALRARGIEPLIGLWHFTLPQWFADKGGFSHPDAPEYFARYCAYVVKELGGSCHIWSTMNEPMVYLSKSYIHGEWPPFRTWSLLRWWRTYKNIVAAHRTAAKRMRNTGHDIHVGMAKHNVYFRSMSIWAAPRVWLARWFWNRRFLNAVVDTCDHIGVNYYFHTDIGGKKEQYTQSDMGWDLFPEGIYHVLRELDRYDIPVYVTEAGIADASDTRRGAYIQDLVYWIHRAISAGVDVRGYMYWSLLDNFEWAEGFWPRFGLVEIEYETQRRTVRQSAYVYERICRENALTV